MKVIEIVVAEIQRKCYRKIPNPEFEVNLVEVRLTTFSLVSAQEVHVGQRMKVVGLVSARKHRKYEGNRNCSCRDRGQGLEVRLASF